MLFLEIGTLCLIAWQIMKEDLWATPCFIEVCLPMWLMKKVERLDFKLWFFRTSFCWLCHIVSNIVLNFIFSSYNICSSLSKKIIKKEKKSNSKTFSKQWLVIYDVKRKKVKKKIEWLAWFFWNLLTSPTIFCIKKSYCVLL